MAGEEHGGRVHRIFVRDHFEHVDRVLFAPLQGLHILDASSGLRFRLDQYGGNQEGRVSKVYTTPRILAWSDSVQALADLRCRCDRHAIQMASLGFLSLLPAMQKDLAATYSQISLFTGMYGIIALLVSPSAGVFSTRIGEKNALLIGLAGTAIGLAALSRAEH